MARRRAPEISLMECVMPARLVSKTEQLREAMALGDHHAALKIAARFQRLGELRDPIQRGWAALTNRQFYIDIKQDPDQLVTEGIAAIKAYLS